MVKSTFKILICDKKLKMKIKSDLYFLVTAFQLLCERNSNNSVANNLPI